MEIQRLLSRLADLEKKFEASQAHSRRMDSEVKELQHEIKCVGEKMDLCFVPSMMGAMDPEIARIINIEERIFGSVIATAEIADEGERSARSASAHQSQETCEAGQQSQQSQVTCEKGQQSYL